MKTISITHNSPKYTNRAGVQEVIYLGTDEKEKGLPDGTKPVQLGSGTITRVLSRNSSSVVYEIFNKKLEEKRAVKLLRSSHTIMHDVALFQNEIRINAQLNHPNIITTHDGGFWNELPYIEMERVYGYSLLSMLKLKGALPPIVSVAIAISICKALSWAHDQTFTIKGKDSPRIIHGDLKPSNIFITNDATIKIMDFGIKTISSRCFKSAHFEEYTDSIAYIAPEYLSSSQGTLHSDIFSFGCIFYEMLSGKKVFTGDNPTCLYHQRLRNDFTPIEMIIKISPAIPKLISWCLRKDPFSRPLSMHLVCAELEDIFKCMTDSSPQDVLSDYLKNRKPVLHKKRLNLPKLFKYSMFAFPVTAVLVILLILLSGKFQFQSKQSATLVHIQKDSPQSIKSSPDSINSLINQFIKSAMQASDTSSPIETSHESKSEQSSKGSVDKQHYTRKALIDLLYKQYSTRDLMTIYRNESQAGHHPEVLLLYDMLPSSDAKSKDALLLKLRTIVAMDSSTDKFFKDVMIADAEYFLLRGKYLYSKGQFKRALSSLDSADKYPATLIDIETLQKNLNLYRARCWSELFENDVNRVSFEFAMMNWSKVLRSVEYNPQHPATEEARKAIADAIDRSESAGVLKN